VYKDGGYNHRIVADYPPTKERKITKD